ncbi:MAG: dipeptide epimerase [Phycisphaerae bacterium]|nr:dipeptide epimerase [Gemmatimonadaceae bacterium]
MQLTCEIITVHTKNPFIIARGGTSEYRVVWVKVRDADGAEGWGEAAPSRFYGESAESVVAAVQSFAPLLENADAWSLDAIEKSLELALRWNAAARCAVSAALHDLQGKRLGVPLWKLWGLDAKAPPQSSFTIGIAPDEDTLRARVREASGYPVLKVKLGSNRDVENLRIVRKEAPTAILRVDANAAWNPKLAMQMMDTLVQCGVEMLEQPVPAHDIAGLRFIRERSPIPVVADESCLVATDIPRLAEAVDGVNIKLAKCGSLREAIRMIAVARAHGMKVMCGCMIETTLGIAAAAHFAPLLDYADLDGAALLSDDPFDGPSIPSGVITLGDAPGLGVTRR